MMHSEDTRLGESLKHDSTTISGIEFASNTDRAADQAVSGSERADDIAPVSFMLKRAAQYSADLYAAQLGNSGLTQRQFTVLDAVLRNDGANQTELVRETGIDRSTLADLVSRLESQGYLQRRRSDADGRVNYVFLTSSGRNIVTQCQPGAGEVDQALLNALPARLRKNFVASLRTLSDKLHDSA
jgi:DNA-binding MarR family transcriptional regulator